MAATGNAVTATAVTAMAGRGPEPAMVPPAPVSAESSETGARPAPTPDTPTRTPLEVRPQPRAGLGSGFRASADSADRNAAQGVANGQVPDPEREPTRSAAAAAAAKPAPLPPGLPQADCPGTTATPEAKPTDPEPLAASETAERTDLIAALHRSGGISGAPEERGGGTEHRMATGPESSAPPIRQLPGRRGLNLQHRTHAPRNGLVTGTRERAWWKGLAVDRCTIGLPINRKPQSTTFNRTKGQIVLLTIRLAR